jgi:hypothetical protein
MMPVQSSGKLSIGRNSILIVELYNKMPQHKTVCVLPSVYDSETQLI